MTSLKTFYNVLLILQFGHIVILNTEGKILQTVLPVLNFVTNNQTENDWEPVSLSNVTEGIFSPVKSTLILNCTANYPIEWFISGILSPSEFVHIQPYHRILNDDGTYEFQLKLFVFFSEKEPAYSSSVIACRKIGDPTVSSKYSVFVPGAKALVVRNSINPTIVPCATTNPTANVTLHRILENGTLQSVDDKRVPYVETEGFISSTILQGTYKCVAKVDGGEEHVVYQIPEGRREVGIFVGEVLEIPCYVPLDDTLSYRITANDSSIIREIKSQKVTETLYRLIWKNATVPLTGTVVCGGSKDNSSAQTWDVRVSRSVPILYLDNYEGEVDCLSDHENRSVSTARCSHPSECSYMKHCFDDPDSCNFRRKMHFKSSTPTRCYVVKKNFKGGKPCASLPYYYPNGIARCSTGNVSKDFLYFTGLDFRKYSNWQQAPRDALIKMQQIGQEIVCEAVTFLFADNIRISLVYQNGTRRFLKDSECWNPPMYEHPGRMADFNVMGVVNISLINEEVATIQCHAPWWNSTQYLTTKMPLTAHNKQICTSNNL